MRKLKKWMSNQVFVAAQAAGLGPEGFVWDGGDDDDICLRHRSSGAYFVFGGDASRYVARYAAGDDPEWELEAYSWQAQMKRVEQWLADVKRDTEMPDLWSELWRQTELLGGASDEAFENTPFTPDERKEIARKLNELREYVKATYYSLSEPQLADLDSKLAYLVDAAGRLGRKDWLMACVGAIFAYFLAAALPPDASRVIFQMLMSSIGHFFGHGFYLGSG